MSRSASPARRRAAAAAAAAPSPAVPPAANNLIARTSAVVARRVFSADAVSLRAARPLSWRVGLAADLCAGVTSWLTSTALSAHVAAALHVHGDVECAVLLAACLVLLPAVLLGDESLRRCVDLHPGSVRLLSALAIASFWLPQSSLRLRYLALGVGVTADQCAQFANLFERGERRRRALSGLLLAFVAIHLQIGRAHV